MRRLLLIALFVLTLPILPAALPGSPRAAAPAARGPHMPQAAGLDAAAAARAVKSAAETFGKPPCPPEPPGDPGTAWMLIGHYTTNFPESSDDRNYNMELSARKLCGRIVPAGGVFSFNEALGQASRENGYRVGRVFIGDRIVPGYGGGVCQVASTIYNAGLRAGMRIAERHQHGLTVPYLHPGEDATIAYGYLDLKLRNDSPDPMRLLVRARGGRLTAEFFGSRQPPSLQWRHQTLDTTPFRTIRTADAQLAQGKEVVDAPGQGGVRVHSWIARQWQDGKQETLDVGVDSYRPSPRIIRYGTASS